MRKHSLVTAWMRQWKKITKMNERNVEWINLLILLNDLLKPKKGKLSWIGMPQSINTLEKKQTIRNTWIRFSPCFYGRIFFQLGAEVLFPFFPLLVKLSIHPSMTWTTYPHKGQGRAGAHPSYLWAVDRVHPQLIASQSQGTQTYNDSHRLTHSHTSGQFWAFTQRVMHVLGICEETRVPGENPRGHG